MAQAGRRVWLADGWPVVLAPGVDGVRLVVHGVEAGRRDGYYYYSRYYGTDEKAERLRDSTRPTRQTR